MEYRTLGQTGLKISRLGFGVWTVATSWWGVDESLGVDLLRKAYEKGVTFFDTADTYGDGRGETILAEALGDRRDKIVIATKFGYDFEHGRREGHKELPQDFSPAFVRRAVEGSLSRLGTDYIDLYQLHNPRIETIQSDDLFATLEELKAEGKIRHYAAALGPDIGWEEEGMASMRERSVLSLQVIYSILEQDPARAFFPVAQETGTALLARVPHASGMLDGTYDKDTVFPETDHRAHRKQEWLDNSLRRTSKLDFLYGPGTGRTIAQAAIQFVLAEPTITSVLPNFLSEAQLTEFTDALDTPPLTGDELARIADLYDHDFYVDEPASVESVAQSE
ncbi:MAG: aldo/keto reductase [Chloroflexi bacterium]|nr:aldo/keto reductase [Chloroflexota bacterium]